MMKRTAFLFATLIVMLILSACSPSLITSSASQQPTPVIEISSATGYQQVQVDQVQAEVGVGSPIPVQVSVSGTLPDTCAQIELVQQKQVGSKFDLTISTIASNADGCVQDALPFKIVIPLNITNLPSGPYSVEVNGSRADFEIDTANMTSTQPTADSVIRKDDIQVANVNMNVGVGSPIPVHAIVGINLPNTCAQLGEIRLHRDGTTFYIQLIADIAERADCQENLPAGSLPFRLEIPLNIVNLPDGPHEVNVNGVTTSFNPHPQSADNTDLSAFESQLKSALMRRDAEAMRALMGERFILTSWQSEVEAIPSDQAVKQLLNSHLAEHDFLDFQEFQNIPAFDPKAFVGPDVQLAKAIYVFNWGVDYRSQALLFVSRRPDSSLFWQGVLVAPKGFAPPSMEETCSEAEAVPVVNGQASHNGISFKIDASLDYGLTARTCAAKEWNPQRWNDAHPPFTEFFFPTYSRDNVDSQPQIRVYEVTGDLQHYMFPLNLLDDLKTTLAQRPEPVTWFQHSPLHTHQTYLEFANGAGVRGLIQYMQDYFFYTNNGLIYEFHGLTQDGRHFVSVRYPVSVPFLMELKGPTLPPNNINPNAIAISNWPGDHEQQRQVIEAYNNEALQRFEHMPDSDVFPSLALLDQLVQSIQVNRP